MGPHVLPGLNFAQSRAVIDTGWNASVDRRHFVHSLLGFLAVAALPRSDALPLRVGILSAPSAGLFSRGVGMGFTEAARTESLFKRKLIQRVTGANVEMLIAQGASAIVGNVVDSDAERIAIACNAKRVVYLDCGTRTDSFRRRCDPYVFHVEASESMYRNAAKVAGSADIALWNPSLERYGAAQLNDRFRSAAGKGMDGAAWCGWFAIKVIVESALRMKEGSAVELREYLTAQKTEFDGHKGAPLSFRSWDHQLRQPLYVVSAGRAPRDIPDLARSGGSMRDLLDSIGDSSSSCKVSR